MFFVVASVDSIFRFFLVCFIIYYSNFRFCVSRAYLYIYTMEVVNIQCPHSALASWIVSL